MSDPASNQTGNSFFLDGNHVIGPLFPRGTSNSRGLFFDATNEVLYAADGSNRRILSINVAVEDPNDWFKIFAGSPANGPSDAVYVEGDTKGASPVSPFVTPCAITIVGGALYVLDSGFHTVSKISLTGNQPLTFVAGGKSTTAGQAEAGPVSGNAARFNTPAAMCSGKRAGKEVLYVADTGNHCIRMIDPLTQQVTTLAGSLSGVRGHDDGAGSQARFDTPVAITADHEGNVYVGEMGTPRLRRIAPDGATATLAGGEASGDSDGNGTSSRFGAITALAARLDSNGKLRALYMVDNGTSNQGVRLRVLQPTP